MARPKSLGAYAPLSATYSDDDAILEVGERAELLFVRALAFCSASQSDGFITDRQLSAKVGAGLPGVPARARALVDAGLWERVEGGYVVRSWLKWNKSAEQIGRARKQDRERKAALTDAVRAEVYERDGFRCRYCASTSMLALDHILPLALGGGHQLDNLQTLCMPCNDRKGSKDATGLSVDDARQLFGITYGMTGVLL